MMSKTNFLTPSLVVLAAATAAPSAMAQEDNEPEDVITVTGSRIERTELTAPQPLQAVSEDDIRFSGETNIIDVVRELPALIGSQTGEQNAGGQGSIGAATLNLRNLGAERTLTLVDGQRHVSGLAGTSSVDINTIPSALVERVEVITGGAAAVYGADAVTGVVNFILKDDFEGFEGQLQGELSDEGDGFNGFASGTWGKNLLDGRANATVSLTYEYQDNVTYADRDFARGDRVGGDYPNPALFVQADDIAQYGLDRLLLGERIGGLCGSGDLGAADGDLCGRIEGQPSRAYLPFPRFNLTSYGSLVGVDFFGDEFLSYYPGTPFTDLFGSDLSGINLGADGLIFDLDGNGVEDCLETVNGVQLQRFDAFAGCHVTRAPGGAADVFQDGLLGGTQNAFFGGDGTLSGRDQQDIIPEDERFTANVRGRYDLTEWASAFVDAKYSYSKTVNDTSQSVGGFYDSWVIELENPYVPDNLRDAITTFVNENPGTFSLDDVNVLVGRDMTDLGPAVLESERQTIRIVGGVEGEIPNTAFDFDFAVNYGRTDADSDSSGTILQDRLYAAVDVVTDPATGNPVCRSELDPTAEPIGSFLASGGPFRGFQTFTPGQGDCVPLNLFGIGAPSAEAGAFVTTTIARERTIEQFVVSSVISGDSSDFFELPAGPIGVAFGSEYRKETSEFRADPLELPQPDPLGSLPVTSRVFPVDGPTDNVSGEFNVWEVFGEVSVPLVADAPLFELLQFDAAYRYSNYDTLGETSTWNVGGIWAPNNSLRFRTTISQTVRAPNVNELFSPLQSTTSRPIDPCDVAERNDVANRDANCTADGIPADFEDPLTARVGGFTGGNPDLDVETADTFTIGLVLTPESAPGLSVTLDYYSINIEDAIEAVGFQELLEACYDAATFPNQFCGTFDRDRTDGSATFLGLSSFTSTDLNFAAVETAGWDFQADYRFAIDDVLRHDRDYGDLALRVSGNFVEKLERFEDPVDSTVVNDLLFELGQPQVSINSNVRYTKDRFSMNYQLRYLGEFLQPNGRAEIEDAYDYLNGWTGEMFRHDIAANYELTDRIEVYGGVNNVAGEEPVSSSLFYPYGPMGRSFFLGLRFQQ